ncbi:MAG: ABC transporter substrate-binding protein, partial [Spirochaetales bacterium]|nr:ABC transporter substrate-binding protein [Candidatus Physcosoma equi]
ALETILSGFGLVDGKDVFIEYKSEHAECVAALASDKSGSALAMLPQPFATSAMIQNSSFRILMDLNDLWETLTGTQLVTGCAVVTKAFAEAHPEAVAEFLSAYKASVDFVNANTADASALIEKYGIIKAAVAQKALPYCNIVCWTGEELRTALDVYLNALYNQNPKSVGGKVPGDEFYF